MVTAYDPRATAINVAANTTVAFLPAIASADLSVVTLAEFNAGTTVQCAIREINASGSVATSTEQFLCDAEVAQTTGATTWSIDPIVIQSGDPQAANPLLDALVPGTVRYIVQRRGLPHAAAAAAAQKISVFKVEVTLNEPMPMVANVDGQKYENRIHVAVKQVKLAAAITAG